MKLVYFILVVLLSGCTIQGNAIYSQGLITGWQHNDFKNTLHGVEIFFSVENRDYIKLDETFVGVTTKDRKLGIVPAIGNKPFKVKVEVKTTNQEVYIKQNATLVLNGNEFLPSKIKVGVDSVKSGRVSNDVLVSDYDNFMYIDNTLEGIDHNWLWLEFDIATPHPNQKFTLFLDINNGDNKETLEANFNAKKISIYHH